MKLARRLLGSQPLSKYYDREEFPGAERQSDIEHGAEDEILGVRKKMSAGVEAGNGEILKRIGDAGAGNRAEGEMLGQGGVRQQRDQYPKGSFQIHFLKDARRERIVSRRCAMIRE